MTAVACSPVFRKHVHVFVTSIPRKLTFYVRCYIQDTFFSKKKGNINLMVKKIIKIIKIYTRHYVIFNIIYVGINR